MLGNLLQGLNLRILHLLYNHQVKLDIYGKGGIRDTLEFIKDNLEFYNIGGEVQESIRRKINELKENYNPKKGDKFLLPFIEKQSFNESIQIWKDRIQREIEEIFVIEIAKDSLFDAKKLRKGAIGFFPRKIWNKLQKIQKNDLEDCIKCLLIQAWTPAGMIAIRAFESGVRTYYTKITKNSPDMKNWGTLLNELRNYKIANKKLLGYLDYFKDIRNSLQHPDIIIDQYKAEDIFNHTKEFLREIYS